MPAEQYLVVTPTGVTQTLTSAEYVAEKITEVEAENLRYSDKVSSITLTDAKAYADSVVAQSLAELIPVFPAPEPPLIGNGALEITKADGGSLILRDESYTQAVGLNATATAIAQSNAFTLTQVDKAVSTTNGRCDDKTARFLAEANVYTDHVQAILNASITTSRLAAVDTSAQYTNLKSQDVLAGAKLYTDEQIAQVSLQGLSLQGLLYILQQMKEATIIWPA